VDDAGSVLVVCFLAFSGIALMAISVRGLRRGRIDGPRVFGRGTVPYDREGSPIRWGCSIVFYVLAALALVPLSILWGASLPVRALPALGSWLAALASLVATALAASGREERRKAARERDELATQREADYRTALVHRGEEERLVEHEKMRLLPGAIVAALGVLGGVASVVLASVVAGIVGVVLSLGALGVFVRARPKLAGA